jgi:hypothetical protein
VVRKGTPVSFTARSGGAAVTVPSWEFVPGSTTPANETSACGPNGANPCVVTVKNTGELRAARYLNGRWRSASSQLRVYTTFTLAADKSEVPPGAVVTFTPTLDGVDGIASRWVWRDSTGQAQADPCASINSGKCAYAPTATGTMWAYTNSNDSAFVPVRVRPATLKLNALQTIVLVDSADSFVALGNGAVVIQGWTFRSDFAPMAASSKTSGTDGLRFRPSAGRSPMLAPTGSRRAASVGSAWGACVPGQNACTQSLAEAGTVFVIGTVDGVTLEDSVHVDVLEMPPPIDSLAVEPPGVEYQCPPTYYQSRTWTATATTGEPVTIYSPIIRSVSFPDAGQLDPLYTGIPYGLYTPVLMTSPPNFVGTGVMRMICKTWLLNNTSPTGAPLFGGRLLFHDAVVALSEQH